MRRALVVSDVVALTLAFATAERVFSGAEAAARGRLDLALEIVVFLVAVPLWLAAAKLAGLYDLDGRRTNHSTVDEVLQVVASVTVGAWLFLVLARVTGLVSPPLEKVLGFWILSIGLVIAGRVAARWIVRRTARGGERTIIVGAGYVGHLIAEKLANHPEYGLEVVGFVDAAPRHPLQELTGLRTLGRPEVLVALVAEHEVERVLVAFSLTSDQELLPAVRELRRGGVRIDIVPRFFEVIGPGALVDDVEGLTTMSMPPVRQRAAVDRLKRGFDVVVATVALVLLTPILAAVGLLVALDSQGPVLYRHRRIGLGGRQFDLFKFRTMRLEYCRGTRYGGEEAERAFAELLDVDGRREEFERSYKLTADPRVTHVGRFLRRSSLDELPQLINVIRGDISLVGPRPITEDELGRYGELVDVLLGVRPGITGYWQINGRSNTDYVERVRLDLAYLMDRSLGLDLKILARTPHALRSRHGAC